MKPLRVNGARLWQGIEEINRFGATPEGGVCRLEFSPESKQARDLFVSWCRDAGCTVRIDRFGNIFARRPGRNNDLPAVIADESGVSLDIRVHSVIDYVPFNKTLVGWVREAAVATGLPWREMYTGAGHDAVNIAQEIPTAMIFVPCKDGISHNPAEDAQPEHLEAGANVLAEVIRRAANFNGNFGDENADP